jgi:hypothetical protein
MNCISFDVAIDFLNQSVSSAEVLMPTPCFSKKKDSVSSSTGYISPNP